MPQDFSSLLGVGFLIAGATARTAMGALSIALLLALAALRRADVAKRIHDLCCGRPAQRADFPQQRSWKPTA
jgi:hypothetical protein